MGIETTIYDVMTTRRSIRRFKNKEPSKEMLEKLIMAASAAPSASNKQPWRFLVISNKEIISDLAVVVEKQRQEVVSMVDDTFRSPFENYSKNFRVFENAPTLLVPTYRTFPLLSQILDVGSGGVNVDAIKRLEYDSALISISCAIQNILLTAHDLGLGTCCMTGPLIAVEELKKRLSIHPGWDIACLIAVGYGDEEPPMPSRKPLESILSWFP